MLGVSLLGWVPSWGVELPTTGRLIRQRPTTLYAVSIVTNEPSRVRFACSETSDAARPSATFTALTVTDRHGESEAKSFEGSFARDGHFVSASVGSSRFVLTPTEGGGGGGASSSTYVTSTGVQSVVRAAWASWNAKLSCSLSVNRRRLTPQAQSRWRAQLLFAEDLDEGVSVGATPGRAAAVKRRTLVTEDYVFAFLTPDAGWSGVRAGGQQHMGLGRYPWLAVAGQHRGPWLFEANLAVQTRAAPLLWIVRVPI